MYRVKAVCLVVEVVWVEREGVERKMVSAWSEEGGGGGRRGVRWAWVAGGGGRWVARAALCAPLCRLDAVFFSKAQPSILISQ